VLATCACAAVLVTQLSAPAIAAAQTDSDQTSASSGNTAGATKGKPKQGDGASAQQALPTQQQSEADATANAAPNAAAADDTNTLASRKLSGYEAESIDIARQQVAGELEPEPEGKIVEGVAVVPLEVFEERDKVPLFLNWFHVTTLKGIIRREVLLHEGEPYRQALADETERNLRAFSQLSVVLLVPLKGSTPDKVRILVVTKDVWSLRLSWEPSIYDGKLTGLSLHPSETNLGGTTQRVSGNLVFTSRTYWVGGSYYVPRIAGSRVNGYLSANAVLNCQTGEFEGATGVLDYGQPLYSSLTKWSWRTAASWSSLVRQPPKNYGQSICSDTGASDYSRWTDWSPAIRQDDDWVRRATFVNIPYKYREDRLRGQFVLTRSFYRLNKLNLSFGAEADQMLLSSRRPSAQDVSGDARVLIFDEPDSLDEKARRDAGGFSPAAADITRATEIFRAQILALNPPRLGPGETVPTNQLITGDRRVSPYVQLHAFRNRYHRTINYDTLGLQEDVQLGHNVYLRLYPAFRPLSSRTQLGIFSSAAYTVPFGSGFVRGLAASTVEMATDGNEFISTDIDGTDQSDATIQTELHVASPDLYLGRFVSNASLLYAPLRFLQRFPYGLGGTDRLRGYKPIAFRGTSRFVINNEFRTRPLRIFSVLVGANLFYDVGDAAYDLGDLELRHGGGVGLRFLFPQLDRDVFRVDFGFPLQSDPEAKFSMVAGFSQVFEAPSAPPPVLLPQ
jgi:hypothetical protein